MLSLSALVWLLLTVILYAGARMLYRRYPRTWLSPLIVAPLLLIVLLLVTGSSYKEYNSLSHWLSAMLGPATIAFALPIYEYRGVIRRHWLSLSAGVLAGMITAVLSTVILSRLFGLPVLIERSLAVRSISTPFALAAAPELGGQADLAAIFVVITGLGGMIIGELLLLRFNVRSALARGAMFGAGAHAVGTVTAHRRDPEEGVISSLTMIIAGILMLLTSPWLAGFF
ncbi:MAG: murein hydrolase effector protein LrgB [Candidatus Dactylopiibacterium carminicum]|uniref:LrgB family protein n=1 Tax=Candidatus Dactylopiibacterium carminicum TaxID=857335 RepID=A0A272EUR9_9RHOO|nr:LrgB family protein [Candidatus Dactylopiibacterium carminicum]KAF7600325.1 LrgB family protein [Candidatus Dactylopiibacterium carminicum]PAS93337.1 MAG: murein hydrolase effector protein LrgB [Candidatus Dactylopiibacterium carminicum]PAS93847.1 MAG: murein hydrolase effector protein LrgB [Candidatus Dactylopiibacterium carminicum]PAT00327.1 MAG: murein hydrolase effector protein LrgB [Candidatus Dactylopiibacterium carminicum]